MNNGPYLNHKHEHLDVSFGNSKTINSFVFFLSTSMKVVYSLTVIQKDIITTCSGKIACKTYVRYQLKDLIFSKFCYYSNPNFCMTDKI